MRKLLLGCACTLLSTTIFAQSAELSKFNTFYKIKDTVSSFEPLRQIIDCGFTQLTLDPTSNDNSFVVTILTSNTSTGLKAMSDKIKYDYDWAKYVESELAKKLADNTLSTESKAAFALVDAVLKMNTLPVTAERTPKTFVDLRKSFDAVYKIYPSLPYMIYSERKFERASYNFMTRAERVAYYKKMSKMKNEKVSAEFGSLYKEHTTPFDLKFTSSDGREIDLKDYRGKVVLIDFWATWCGPCVAEMPHVKEVYEKYNKKGFEVIGISLDAEKSRLDAYVKKNGLSWPQYFDGKGWKNDIAAKLGITSLPTVYLIDRDGAIFTKDGRAEELDEAMKILFDKK